MARQDERYLAVGALPDEGVVVTRMRALASMPVDCMPGNAAR